MTYGGNAQLKNVYHTKERKLIRSHLESYKRQLADMPKADWFGKSPRMIGLEAKKELCEKLLG